MSDIYLSRAATEMFSGFQVGGTRRPRHADQDTTSTPATVPPDTLSPTAPLSSRESVDVSDPPLRRGRGRPRKQVVAQPSPPPAPGLPPTQASTEQPPTVPSPTPPTLFFDMVIHILLPDKVSRTANRKTKTSKQDPLTYGPLSVPLLVEWNELLAEVASTLATTPNQLVITSFAWRLIKPANSPFMPLTTAQGLPALVRQLTSKAAKQDGSACIVLRMLPPTAAPTLVSTLFIF